MEFEKSFNHFFDDCERGFINELIINMFCRIMSPGKIVLNYKSNVKEMYFIRQGIVEIQNNENDSVCQDKPILYLPKYSYFGDYQILMDLKSNLVIKTLDAYPNSNNASKRNNIMQEPLPEIIFMCVNKEKLKELCELFPKTEENIKARALERRKKLMNQRNINSRKYWNNRAEPPQEWIDEEI